MTIRGNPLFTLPQYHGVDILYGGAGNDSLTGDGAADELYGEEGDDTLYGGNSGRVQFLAQYLTKFADRHRRVVFFQRRAQRLVNQRLIASPLLLCTLPKRVRGKDYYGLYTVANQCHWLILGDFSGLYLPERVGGRQGIEIEEYFHNGLGKAPRKNNKNNKNQVEARGSTGRTHQWQAFLL